jgi:hypothetical protein
MADPVDPNPLNSLPTHPGGGEPVVTSTANDEAFKAHAAHLWEEIDSEAVQSTEKAPPSAPEVEHVREPVTKAEAVQSTESTETPEARTEPDEPPKIAKIDDKVGHKGLKEEFDSWTRDEALKLKREGTSIPEIAAKLGISSSKLKKFLSAPVTEKAATPAEVDPIDSLEPHPAASEEHKSQFAKLRSAAKGFRDTARTYQAKLGPLAKEFGVELGDGDPAALDGLVSRIQSIKQQAINGSPENTAELEGLRYLARKADIERSLSFNTKYQIPLSNAFNQWIDRIAPKFNDTPENLEKWKADMKSAGVDQITGDWMREAVDRAAKSGRANQDDINILWSEISPIQDFKTKKDTEAHELASKGDPYQNWKKAVEAEEQQRQAEAQQKTNEAFAFNHQDESRIILEENPDIKKYIDSLTPEQYGTLKERYAQVVYGFNSGPRQAARLGHEFIRLEEQNRILREENAKLKSEVPALKSEVTSRRKVSDAPFSRNGLPSGTPTAKPAKPPAPKLGQTNARNSLDDAFRNWQT